MKTYFTSGDLLKWVIESKSLGRITTELANGMIYIAERTAKKYERIMYKDVLIKEALSAMTAFWDRFDETKSNNPFAFYCTISVSAVTRFMNAVKKSQANLYFTTNWDVWRKDYPYMFFITSENNMEIQQWAQASLKGKWQIEKLESNKRTTFILMIKSKKDAVLGKMVWG